MSAALGSLIAVLGTLLGSFSTYLFQQRTAIRAEAVAREERLRQEHLAAYSEFASAVTELKRAVVGVPVVMAVNPTMLLLTCGDSLGNMIAERWAALSMQVRPIFVGFSAITTGTPSLNDDARRDRGTRF
ncbi:hypothetical protein [Streptosporangium sp. H16]|uniref:hypothetical protein n=1 Tax=Streptosporangium sp. H16 TaxID=3444184 RepID=UPI003F792992